MSSVPPDSDDEDTGPLHVSTAPPVDDEWNPAPAQGTWAGRFDAPLSVSPRSVQAPRNPKVLLGAVAALAGIAVVGALVFWLVRPSSDDADAPAAEATTSAPPSPSEDDNRLLLLVPRGYASDVCVPVSPPKDVLAQLNCDRNDDTGGPLSATYSLTEDKAALDAVFNAAVQSANQVNCPGNIQSPGPWRRNATPQKISGTLFCGMKEGRPTVVWTDDANLVVSAVQSGPAGPAFPELYAWWSAHS